MGATMTSDEVFTAFVHVTDATGENHAYQPGDPVPGWAQKLVGEHAKTRHTEYVPEVEPRSDGFEDDPAPEVEAGEDIVLPPHPPTSGPGSSRYDWAKWAKSVGMTVNVDMSRQDIIDGSIRLGHIVE